MAAAALIGYGSLLGLVFGVRTLLHLRRTGETGWLPPPSRAAWLGDGLFTLGVAATLAAPALQLTGVIEPPDVLDSPVVNAAGTTLLGAGAAVAVVAQAQMGDAWRAGIDVSGRDRLLERGLFGVVRNPFYLGLIIASVGVAGMSPNGVAILGVAGLIAGCEIDVRWVEEPALLAVHGDAYRSYTASTPRFVPNPLRRGPTGSEVDRLR